jgi:hypothetical protein
MEGNSMTLLYPDDVDRRLSWPLGKAERLGRQRRFPYVLLPDGSIRFRWSQIEPLVIDIPPGAGGEVVQDAANEIGGRNE